MFKALKWFILGTIALFIAGVTIWRHQVTERIASAQRFTEQASETMSRINHAQDSLQTWLPQATHEINRLVLQGDTQSARERINTELIPKLDNYLSVANQAISQADTYQEYISDPSIQSKLEQIRRHTASISELRTTLVSLKDGLETRQLNSIDKERFMQRILSISRTIANISLTN